MKKPKPNSEKIPGLGWDRLPSNYRASKPFRVSAPQQAIDWWAALSAQERGSLVIQMHSAYLAELEREARKQGKI